MNLEYLKKLTELLALVVINLVSYSG